MRPRIRFSKEDRGVHSVRPSSSVLVKNADTKPRTQWKDAKQARDEGQKRTEREHRYLSPPTAIAHVSVASTLGTVSGMPLVLRGFADWWRVSCGPLFCTQWDRVRRCSVPETAVRSASALAVWVEVRGRPRNRVVLPWLWARKNFS